MNAVVRSLKPLGCPKGIDPRTWRQAIEKQLNDLFDRATALITALDIMDADSADLEDGADDEPSLGWTLRGGMGGMGDTLDLEQVDEDGGDINDMPQGDDCPGESV
ncbi:hypothetical protein [Mesorhizobium sp.]|uniref:hypothetical protein n=1 Tax=Mesorhizobium sp. TaxID=1871066 RepID=UPI000FE7EAB5|nr:hypothetical protein [Mesorhizobium sp.]RWN05733.1 MAG: hypothetical protein EOR87_31875 [Mesorhizobium sp.]RWN06686.1 MAG: hypothetical protein EOR88_31840 [Mesorhizobium sp.]